MGYNKVTLQNGLNLVGNNWKLVGGSIASMTDVLDASTLSGMDLQTGDFPTQIQTWTGSGYETYGWTGYFGDDAESAPYNYKWLDQDSNIANITTKNGMAFWLNTKEIGTVTFSGEVSSNNTETVTIEIGLNMLANPYPETVSIQTIQAPNLPGMDLSTGDFPTQLQIWTGSGYRTYGWTGYFGDDPESAPYNYKWLDEDSNIATEQLSIGAGFWISTTQSGSVTFTK